jgi:hypothetical protein
MHAKKSGGTPRAVNNVRGEAKVWFYVNPESVDVYIRPAKVNGSDSTPASIWFRLSFRDLIGWRKKKP